MPKYFYDTKTGEFIKLTSGDLPPVNTPFRVDVKQEPVKQAVKQAVEDEKDNDDDSALERALAEQRNRIEGKSVKQVAKDNARKAGIEPDNSTKFDSCGDPIAAARQEQNNRILNSNR